MSDIAIRVDNLSKLYKIGTLRSKHDTLRDRINDLLFNPFKKLAKVAKAQRNPIIRSTSFSSDDHIWALKDVSFEVNRGEVIGIIGRNGAGKTTLLKILSRITEPTQGHADIRGRVGSLLEVGTGFHPELTGRENIYLNGAILGMRRAEIDRRFDEIVAFGEIDKFLDTPVKRYSSGMYVRLAFAVAAHLEPEILLVDEVLAVGDAAFQKKCLGKMGDVAKEGRTVLFVSHNMAAVQRLCERVVLLNEGKIVVDGVAERVIAAYLQSGPDIPPERVWHDIYEAPGDDVIRLRAVRVRDKDGAVVERIDIRRPVGIEVEYWNLQADHGVSAVVHFWNEEGIHLFGSSDFNREPRPKGVVKCVCWIPGNFLAEGCIIASVFVVSFTPTLVYYAEARDVVSFEVVDNSTGDGARGPTSGRWPGLVRPLLEWEVSREDYDRSEE